MQRVEDEGLAYLLGSERMGSNVSVALADDGRVLAAADGIHQPVRVVVVHDMGKAPSAPVKRS